MAGLLNDKNVVVMGVANKWSIAWGIAKMFLDEGANVAFTYTGEKTKNSIEKLLEEENYKSDMIIECDVTKDEDIEKAFAVLGERFETIDSVVHSIAHANKDELRGYYFDTSREGYKMAQDISSYSLVAVTRYAKQYMTSGGSIVTLTYLGGERVVKNYNVMGVAKAALEASVKYLAHDLGEFNININAISAGPIKTLAAKGVGGFTDLARQFEEKAPLKRMVTQEEIAGAALFLCSRLGGGVTGEVLHVDCGYSILGY